MKQKKSQLNYYWLVTIHETGNLQAQMQDSDQLALFSP